MAKLLCIDDQAEIRKDLADELRAANHIVFEAQNGFEGLEVIRRYQPDLVLCDVDMPKMDGRALLKEIRKNHAAYAHMPFIFITGFSEREDIIHGKCLGADDYLTKPVDYEIVLATVKSRLAQIDRLNCLKKEELYKRDEEVRSARKTISLISRHDPITGVPNRSQFDDYLKAAIDRAESDKRQVGLLMLDLEKFSEITARFGNPTGDDLLKQVAGRLSDILETHDDCKTNEKWTPRMFNLGGARFAIIYPDVENFDAFSGYADGALDSLAQPFRLGQDEIFTGAKLGGAVFPQDGNNATILQQAASIALHFSKAKGTVARQFNESAMNVEFLLSTNLEQALQNALRKEEFEIHYQPIIEIQTEKIVTMEALVRWRRPQHGLVSPDKFISVAERTGLIVPMTEWILKTACKEAAQWRRDGMKDFKLAVNLSAEHLKESDFLEKMTEIVFSAGYDNDGLEFEITESAIVTKNSLQEDVLKQISAAGVVLSLDDFGTGYSSFAYLKRLPFDILKIDRSFVKSITMDPLDLTTLEMIVNLGQSHGLLLVAEGVETDEQLSILRRLGCNRVQGFKISPPLAVSELQDFVKRYGNGVKVA